MSILRPSSGVNLNHARRLKRFDESNQSKITSKATTPPRSVVGIGGKGAQLATAVIARLIELRFEYHKCTVAKPDYSEAKIVLAMVPKLPVTLNLAPPI